MALDQYAEGYEDLDNPPRGYLTSLAAQLASVTPTPASTSKPTISLMVELNKIHSMFPHVTDSKKRHTSSHHRAFAVSVQQELQNERGIDVVRYEMIFGKDRKFERHRGYGLSSFEFQ